MRYTIELCGQSIEVDVRPLAGGRYAVQYGHGEDQIVDARRVDGLVHLHRGGHSYAVHVGGGPEDITVHARGHTRRADVADDRKRRRLARAGRVLGVGGGHMIRSPMPGKVVRVLVALGDVVAAGQGLVIVEAMKMENELRADSAGVVRTIRVAAGDKVEAHAELIVLEAVDG